MSDKVSGNKNYIEAIGQILGEPVFIGLSEYDLKLRRNLTALSIFIIFYKWCDIQIENIFGLSCRGVEHYKIDIALIIYLIYSALYFFSEAWETYLRWKIRLSGTFTKVPIGFGNIILDDRKGVTLAEAGCEDNQLSLYSTIDFCFV